MGNELYLIEFEFDNRRQLDPIIEFSRREAERRARALVDKGTALAARLIPLRRGRPIVVRPSGPVHISVPLAEIESEIDAAQKGGRR